MRVLLDTHTFLWWSSSAQRLSLPVRELLADPDTTTIVSLVSIWEMQIKQQLGKLTLEPALAEIIKRQQEVNQIELLPILLPHILGLEALPPIHRDPFDRLLIAQARYEDLFIVSADPLIAQYPVKVQW